MTRLFRIGDVFDSILVFIYNLIIECTCDSPVFMISVAFYRSEDPVAPGGGQQDCEVDGNNKLRNEDLVCGGKFSQKHLIHNNYMTACYMYVHDYKFAWSGTCHRSPLFVPHTILHIIIHLN